MNGNDANDGGSWTNAKQTIQNAVDNIDPGRLVLVTNGVYDLGGAVTPGYALTNRVCIIKPITVRSVNGAAVTIIKGAPGSNGSNDLDAVRGVFMTDGVLEGFTITNGYTQNAGDETCDQSGGGLWMTVNCTAGNLIIAHCQANSYGGGAYLINGGALNNSLLRDNSSAGDGGGVFLQSGGTANNCTLSGNSAGAAAGGALVFGGTLNNCIALDNSAGMAANNILSAGGGTLRFTCAPDGVTHGVDGCITNDPLFADSGTGDFSLLPASPCINAGDNTYAPTNMSPSDLAGNPRIVLGTVDMGAYERQTLAAGPYAGGNSITLTNAGTIGNGSDITNIVLGGVATTNITGQGTNWVVFVAPATGSAGLKDIVIQSTSEGDTTFAGAYTVNPAGVIGWMYDDWNQWSEVAGLPDKRYLLAAGSLNGSLYAMGGTEGETRHSTVFRFDGTSWSTVSNLPAALLYLAACEFQGGLHALGGEEEGWAPTDSNYRFDGTNWATATVMPEINMGLAANVLNDRLYAVGGTWWNYGQVYGYDGTNWAAAASMPVWRYYLAAGTLNGKLYAVGGITDIGIEVANTNVYAFDGTNWEEVAGLPAARGYLAASVLNDRLYAIGGSSLGATTYTNVYRFDGTNWQEVAGLPRPRAFHAAATLDGAIYVVGGADSLVRTNVYRYPARIVVNGMDPSSGSVTGGYQVTISGTNLGNGVDITNVTLCGVSVTNIASQSATQVVVWAGVAGGAVTGDVRVFSTSFGETVKSNAFIYQAPTLVVLYDFYLREMNGTIQVCWQTASEEETVGFDLFRWDGEGWVKVNSELIPGTGELGGSYSVADAAANDSDLFRYKLVEYETDGGMQEYGPFDVAVSNPRLENIAITSDGVVLRWLSRDQDTYEVQKSLDIRMGFEPVVSGLPATPPVNVYTDETEAVNSAFYRVRVE